ncbi:MAG: hypothetical protein ACK5TK_06755 [Betaproteobacteria bacterium]
MLSNNAAALLATALLAAAAPAAAQEKSPWRFAAEAFYGGQGDADIDNGGEVGLTFGGIEAGLLYAPSRDWSVGLRLSAQRYSYDFSGTGPIASLNPWSDVDTVTLGLPVFYAFDRNWSLFAQAIVQRSGTKDADSGESGVYGGLAAINYSFAPNRRIGLGAGYFTGLEDDEVVPLLLVDWQFDENWRLANPLPAGPAGGAGLELVRTLGSGWEASLGLAYRTLRFRLDEKLPAAPNGVGEYGATLTFARVRYSFNRDVSLDFYAGAEIGGKIKLIDANGNDLRTDDFSTGPLLAVALTGRF